LSIVVASLAATLALAGCSQDTATGPTSHPVTELPSSHVHGISRDPGSGKVNLATHEGLFVLQATGSWQRVGPVVDLMGFAISGPGTFYASGHPGAGVALPQPAGLLKSTDAGHTWTSLSRGGQSDFHALTASSTAVMGFDGALSTTTDGKTWSPGGLSAPPRTLAAAPDGSRVLATTEQGLLSSTDMGRTWVRLDSAPLLLLTAWADSRTVVGVTPAGRLAVSTDAGHSWRTSLAHAPNGEAISASLDASGALEILLATDSAILQSRDNGATLPKLTA